MKALILAAGYATRLYPLTQTQPKPLLEIADGKKMIEILMDRLAPLSLSEIILVSNRKFIDQFQDWSKSAGRPVTILDDGSMSEDDRLGAVGDMSFSVRARAIQEPLLVIAGDNLFDFSLVPFVEEFNRQVDTPVVGLYEYPRWNHLSKYGIVTLDADNRFQEFVEKPKEPKSNLVSMCLYCFPARTLPWLDEYLSGPDPKDAPGHYIRWTMSNSAVRGHRFRGVWLDIGDMESLEEARKIFSNKR